jgi:hypothetical protein
VSLLKKKLNVKRRYGKKIQAAKHVVAGTTTMMIATILVIMVNMVVVPSAMMVQRIGMMKIMMKTGMDVKSVVVMVQIPMIKTVVSQEPVH